MIAVAVMHLTLLTSLARATSVPAKRDASDSCGFSPVDCGNGWCCIAAMECIPGDPPWCQDLLIPSFSIVAAPYSDLDPARLTSIGITISTFPSTTLTATSALPTYSDSEVKTTSTSSRSSLSTEPTTTESILKTSSTAGVALQTQVPVGVMGVAAACAGLVLGG